MIGTGLSWIRFSLFFPILKKQKQTQTQFTIFVWKLLVYRLDNLDYLNIPWIILFWGGFPWYSLDKNAQMQNTNKRVILRLST